MRPHRRLAAFRCSIDKLHRHPSICMPPPLAARCARAACGWLACSRRPPAGLQTTCRRSRGCGRRADHARRHWAPAAAAGGGGGMPQQRQSSEQRAPPADLPVLLLDVMDTVVYDPFFQDMPKFFNLSFKELLAAKHPTAWVQFERDEIPEEELFRIFFADGRPVDGEALKQHMASCYRYLEGMEPLLQRLAESGAQVHAFSNYPTWWEMIEDKLRLSRYMDWTFVSCLPPLRGLRKPSAESFEAVVSHLGVPPERLLFVDDRQANVEGAQAAGIPAIRFESAAALEEELRRRGFPL